MKTLFDNAGETPLFQPLTTDAEFGTASTPPMRKNPPRRFKIDGSQLPKMKDRVIYWSKWHTNYGALVDKHRLSELLSAEGYGPNDEQLRKSIDSYLITLPHFHKMPIVRCYDVGQRKTWVATYCYGWQAKIITQYIKMMIQFRAQYETIRWLAKDIDKMFESDSKKVKRFINKALGK